MSDTYTTGKLYPKLDAYIVLQRQESEGVELYFSSSNQFRTQRAFKNSLLRQEKYAHLTFRIVRGEE